MPTSRRSRTPAASSGSWSSPAPARSTAHNGTGKTFTIATRAGDTLTCEGRLYTVPWQGENALMLVLVRTAADDRLKASELALRATEAETRELKSILDTATDGVIVVDREGLVLALNRSAEALFGYEYHEMARRPFAELFAPESERAARDYLDGLTKNGVASVLNDGREVIGRVRQGGLIPLFMTMGRIGDGGTKFCAVLRDITQWKRAEEDLLNAKRTAERASSAKSDFLAKISHEIRTPLNAIIGFSEVMMQEQFGPIGNERYREYMKDIHASGEHLVSLINDLLDLSKIEAGKLDLVFASVNLNQLVQQCVALMQPQANQQRIIIRSSLSATLPPVVADARSVRQIVLNLLSNSIKFTGAGGQVIVSTALTDRAEAVLRVRDTGIGMTDKEIETAMEPFRQLATSTRWGSGGTGLGLAADQGVGGGQPRELLDQERHQCRDPGGDHVPRDKGAGGVVFAIPTIRPVTRTDYDQWLPLWDGYNAFYQRVGPTAVPPEVTRMTWQRFFDGYEPMHALVAEERRQAGRAGALPLPPQHHDVGPGLLPAGPVHRRVAARQGRRPGADRGGVRGGARRAGAPRVYWHTHETNKTAMALYDKVAQHSGFVVYRREL